MNFWKMLKFLKLKEKFLEFWFPTQDIFFPGPVAAHCYKAIEGKNFDTVVLIGDSHYEYFDGVSIWDRGEWETPLGRVKVDEELAKEILNFSKRFFIKDSAHLFEHSLEFKFHFCKRF
jgi:AmmeMemoRadiSam system protein B